MTMDTFDRAGSGLTEITNATDSREILAHARRQADARNFDDVFIVDVDAHVDDGGNWGQITQFIEDEVVREAANAFGDGSRKGAFLNGVAGLQWQNVWGRIRHGRDQITLPDGSKTAAEIAMARASMGQMAMDYQVIFPRALLFLGMHPVREMEVHLATAYNRWLVECALPQDPRVKAMLYLPFNTPEAAEKTVERFVGKPGVAGFLVTSSRHKPVHANEYMRLYAMLEEAGQPIGFHAHHNWHDEYTSQLNRFLSMHAISFMLCNLVHLTNWVINGLPERFPKLKTVWIESGIAWLAFAMQRLDNEYLMRSSEAPLLKKLPSEYIAEMFFTTQPMERTNMKLLEATFDAFDAKNQLLYASDWPHWDFDLPSTVWDLPFLDEDAKRNILGYNAARVFNLEVPERYRQIRRAAE
jgi:predicted TIM-barrel fold metal-dependent hydrolase